MDFRNAVAVRLGQWRAWQKQGFRLMGYGLAGNMVVVLLAIPGLPQWLLMAGAAVAGITLACGLYLEIKVYFSVRFLFCCPRCGRKLGYLLLDSSYSKCWWPTIRLPDFPASIRKCPYCGMDFDREERENNR